MARLVPPERNRAARSSRQLRRFRHVINSDKVFGTHTMAEVTYYVALPFLAADDGVAAGEPTECFNPNAAVMALRRYPAKKVTSAQSPLAVLGTLLPAISAMPR